MAGGQVGNRLTDLGAGLMEPGYSEALSQRSLGQNLGTIGGELGTDALAGLGGVALGKLGGAAKGILQSGMMSRAAQGLGQSAELGGKAIQGTADFLGSGTPREMGIAMTDPTGASLYGELAQAPRGLARGGARGLGALGESKWFSDMALGSRFAEGLAGRSAPEPGAVGAEEILSNAGDMIGQKIGRGRAAVQMANNPAIADEARLMELEHLNELRFKGVPFDRAAQKAREKAMEYSSDWAESLAHDAAPKMPMFGSIGRGFDNAAKLGEMGVKAAGVPYDIGVGAARAGGRALRYGGRALRSAGDAAAPLETPMLLKSGSEELMSRLKKRQAALQRQGYDRNIMPETLAENQ